MPVVTDLSGIRRPTMMGVPTCNMDIRFCMSVRISRSAGWGVGGLGLRVEDFAAGAGGAGGVIAGSIRMATCRRVMLSCPKLRLMISCQGQRIKKVSWPWANSPEIVVSPSMVPPTHSVDKVSMVTSARENPEASSCCSKIRAAIGLRQKMTVRTRLMVSTNEAIIARFTKVRHFPREGAGSLVGSLDDFFFTVDQGLASRWTRFD